MRQSTKWLLALLGIAVSILVTTNTAIYLLLLPWFATAAEAAEFVGRSFITSRLVRIFRWIAAILLLRFGLRWSCGICRRLRFACAAFLERARTQWKQRPRYVRITFWCAAAALFAFLVWGTYVLLLLAPFLGELVKRLHYWGLGRAARRWSKRLRRYRIIRIVQGPPRLLLYVIYVQLRKIRHRLPDRK